MKHSLLFTKPREECLRINDMRISYSFEDILIEDFIDDSNHPYAIYNMNGVLLETNLNSNKPMWNLYVQHIDAIKGVIEEFGVDI